MGKCYSKEEYYNPLKGKTNKFDSWLSNDGPIHPNCYISSNNIESNTWPLNMDQIGSLRSVSSGRSVDNWGIGSLRSVSSSWAFNNPSYNSSVYTNQSTGSFQTNKTGNSFNTIFRCYQERNNSYID